MTRRSYAYWQPAEVEYLEGLIGEMPFRDLAARMRRRARAMGWPVRTDRSIMIKLQRLGHHATVRDGAVLTTGGVADTLGCPVSRIEAWLRRPEIASILSPRRVGPIRYLERSGWRQLAREMPRILGGFSVSALYALLEDLELAEAVAREHPRSISDWRVRCVETGRIYRSRGEVAAVHFVTPACVSLAMREGRPVTSLGLTFEPLGRCARPSIPLQAGPIATRHGARVTGGADLVPPA